MLHWSCKNPITDKNLISSFWEKNPSRKELFTLRKALHCTGFWCEAKVKAVSNPNFQQNGSIYLPEVSIRIKETMHTPSHWTLAESNQINWERKLFCLALAPQDLLSLILCKNLFLQVFLQFIFSISDNFHQTAKPISLPISPLISFFICFFTKLSVQFCFVWGLWSFQSCFRYFHQGHSFPTLAVDKKCCILRHNIYWYKLLLNVCFAIWASE